MQIVRFVLCHPKDYVFQKLLPAYSEQSNVGQKKMKNLLDKYSRFILNAIIVLIFTITPTYITSVVNWYGYCLIPQNIYVVKKSVNILFGLLFQILLVKLLVPLLRIKNYVMMINAKFVFAIILPRVNMSISSYMIIMEVQL